MGQLFSKIGGLWFTLVGNTVASQIDRESVKFVCWLSFKK